MVVVSNSALLLLLLVGSPLPRQQMRHVGPVTRCVTRERGSLREGEGLMFYSNRRLAGPLVRNEKAGVCSTTIRRRRGYSRHRGLSYDTKTTEAS